MVKWNFEVYIGLRKNRCSNHMIFVQWLTLPYYRNSWLIRMARSSAAILPWPSLKISLRMSKSSSRPKQRETTLARRIFFLLSICSESFEILTFIQRIKKPWQSAHKKRKSQRITVRIPYHCVLCVQTIMFYVYNSQDYVTFTYVRLSTFFNSMCSQRNSNNR